MKKAIIIGASSGIGKELSSILSTDGYSIGVTARRTECLEALKQSLGGEVYVKFMDISNVDNAMNTLKLLISDMNGVELIVISSGTGYINEPLDWEKEKQTIDVNVRGCSSLINVALKYFEERGYGHIVVISSIAANASSPDAPAYSATKAYLSNYLSGLRLKYSKINNNILITDVQPGFVDTDMAKGDKKFWVATPQKAATQIYTAIKKRKKLVYVTRRWQIVAFILRLFHLFRIEI